MMQPAIEQRLTIGAVLAILRDEFPDMDVTVSKIRFLEAEGLVEPGRTPTGYRKFSPDDVDRLRYTLRMQRDHFLPLKVIREHLEKIDQGWQPPEIPDSAPIVPGPEYGDEAVSVSPVISLVKTPISLTLTDIAEQSGLGVAEVVNLRKLKLINPESGTDEFGADALEIARAIASLGSHGIEARHLASVRNAAERQVELIKNLLAPRLAHADQAEAQTIRSEAQDLAVEILRLQSIVMSAGLAADFGTGHGGKSASST